MEWIIPCAFLFLMGSCGGKKEVPSEQRPVVKHGAFYLALDSNQQVIDSIAIDLNADGVQECVITAGDKPIRANERPMFSIVNVFEFQPQDSSWHSIFIDAVESGEVLYFRDVTGSGSPEIIAGLNSGGNDAIASAGMHVYGFTAENVFTLLFYAPSGKPEFQDLDADGVEEILVQGEYWGVSSRADAFVYTEAVYTFDGTRYTADNQRFSAYYTGMISQYASACTMAKKESPGEEHALYRAAMDLLLWYAASDNMPAMNEFWKTEKTALHSTLSEDLYMELEQFIDNEKSGFRQHVEALNP